jgi:streptogramin lyase
MRIRAMMALGLVSGTLAGCGGTGAEPGSGATEGAALASVTLDLTSTPLDARCVVFTVTPAMGAPVVTQIDVSPGMASVADLSGLPTGAVTLTEDVFTEACAMVTPTTVPTWVSDPVPVTLVAGDPVSVSVTVRRVDAGGQVMVTTNFPTPPTITQFPGGTSNFSIVAGTASDLWFTDNAGNNIGRITTDGVVTLFPIPTAAAGASDITLGPDGNFWFTETTVGQIARVTPAGSFLEALLPVATSKPVGITTGRDGNIWFAESANNVVARLAVNFNAFTEFVVPTASSTPFRITVGPDDNIWFTEQTANQIGRLTTTGTFAEFAIPTAASLPDGITAGPDGNLWFTEFAGNRVARCSTSGNIAEFTVPTPGSTPIQITAGPDGNLWFTEASAGAVARLTTAGVITEFTIPTFSALPDGIATGPDGALWWAEKAGAIGRLHP